jgi:hypothetical protein
MKRHHTSRILQLLTLSVALLMMAVARTPGWTQQPMPAFTISDNNATFSLSGIPTAASNLPASMSLKVGGQGNSEQGFQTWWWYRLPNDNRESAVNGMNVVWTLNQAKNTASANFNLSPTLSSTMDWTIFGGTAGNGLLQGNLTIQNNGQQAVTLAIFHYLDLDLGGTPNDDGASTDGKTPNILIGDQNWVARYQGGSAGFTAFASDAFPTVRNLLTNNAKDDFPNTQTMFAPGKGDWTGGFEWMRTINAGGSTGLGITVRIVPRPMPEPGGIWVFLIGTVGMAWLRRQRSSLRAKTADKRS